MDAYLLLIALGSGGVSIVLALFEVRTIYIFIIENQKIDRVPRLTKKNNENEANIAIRKFRKDLFSNELIEQLEFSNLRTKLRLFRFSMIIFTSIMFILLFFLYWNSSN